MIGAVLKKQRMRRNVTQEQLADILGCSHAMVTQIERGNRLPGEELLQKIDAWMEHGGKGKKPAPRGARGSYDKDTSKVE